MHKKAPEPGTVELDLERFLDVSKEARGYLFNAAMRLDELGDQPCGERSDEEEAQHDKMLRARDLMVATESLMTLTEETIRELMS